MPKLYPEDQARVDEVLSKGIYRVERKPFRLSYLIGGLMAVIGVLSLASFIITIFVGYA